MQGWLELNDRGVLAIGGEEAKPFLQGLLSNDLDRLAPDRALYAALLTPQGKFLFDLLLLERDGIIWADVEAARRHELLQRLTMYRLRAKVTLRDASDTMAVLAVVPPPLPAGSLRGFAAAWGGGIVAVDPRLAELGGRAIVPRAEIAALTAGLPEAKAEAWEALRLRLGVPAAGSDLVVQKSTLLESNFEALDGVAFDKGCYVGQELTARTKYRALVRKRLLPVRAAGPCPPAGTPLLADGRDAGELRSTQGERGLALVRLEVLGDGPITAAGVTLAVEWPAWLPPEPATAES
ncbi:MAG: folate-binding protein [Geminicoccaceae bacterium]